MKGVNALMDALWRRLEAWGRPHSFETLAALAPQDEGGASVSDNFPRYYAASLALMMRSGSLTGSPRLILSTFSIPAITLPQTVYWPLRNGASAKQMKNWLSPESGFCARAIETVPRTCFSFENSALSFL